MEIGTRVTVNVAPRRTRLTGDYREMRMHEQFRKHVNGHNGIVVAIRPNLLNTIQVEVEGYGAAMFNSADLTERN